MTLIDEKVNAGQSSSGGSPSIEVAPGGALTSVGSAARGASLFADYGEFHERAIS